MKYYVLLIPLIIVSCEMGQNNSIVEIKKVLAEQENAWNRGDIEGFMSGYFQNDSLRFASGGHVTFGWKATLERYQKGYPDQTSMGTLTFSNIDVDLLSHDVAMVFGKWELQITDDHPWGLFTLIFRKTDKGWKIIHDHTSSAN